MDKSYWENYYDKDAAPKIPTKFAKEMLMYMNEGKKLLELGCGNGRDSIFFYEKGIQVTAIDQAENIIRKLKKLNGNIRFLNDNFIQTKLYEENFDYIYSRFTLHSISMNEEHNLLNNIFKSLNPDGLLMIEARSIRDGIYGMGECVGENEYIWEKHYRRFINKNVLEKKLIDIGFQIKFTFEGTGCAKYKDEDPVVIRIVAEKSQV